MLIISNRHIDLNQRVTIQLEPRTSRDKPCVSHAIVIVGLRICAWEEAAILGMDMTSRKRPSSRLNAEEVTTFLFDDTYDTSPSGGLGTSSLFGEEILSETVTSSHFQLDSLENTIVEELSGEYDRRRIVK